MFQQFMQHFDSDVDRVGKLSLIWRANITHTITKLTILKAHEAIGISGTCWYKLALIVEAAGLTLRVFLIGGLALGMDTDTLI